MVNRKYIFILIAIITSSCNNFKKAESEIPKFAMKELKPFFDSDKIEHYFLSFPERKFEHFVSDSDAEKKRKNEFFNLFYGYYPNNIPKKNFEELLLKYKYKKSNLSIKQEKEIENVFSEKDSLMDYGVACVPEYRDIFLFKKKEKIVGIAKICFKCGRYQIVGSKLDVNGFGLLEELDKLQKIVHPDDKKS